MRLTAVLLVSAAVAALVAGRAVASSPADVTVTTDRLTVATQLGQGFTFRTTITNDGSTAAEGLIAHLNLLSLRPGVYVDPEDWSARRTRYLATLPAGASRTITWRIEPVASGSFGAYVTVIPRQDSTRVPATGDAVRVEVAGRDTLDTAGLLPIAIGVPVAVGLLALLVRTSRRRGVAVRAPARDRPPDRERESG